MKGIDFLKGFNELAEDIVLEAKKPEQYRKHRIPKGNMIKFAGVAAAVALLVGMVAAGKWGFIDRQTGSSAGNRKTMALEEIEVLDIRPYTSLQVVSDSTKFTPVTQDQSYNPETDMDMNIFAQNFGFVADAGEEVYIAKSEGILFTFQKETNTARLACNKTDCEHKILNLEDDCEANLCMVDAPVQRIQYYKGDLYYSLGDYTGAILYKMSPHTKIKQKYVSLLGKNLYGGGDWIIHRGYIYFTTIDDGFYRTPVDNPDLKEQLIDFSEGLSMNYVKAYGSYIYFKLERKGAAAFARYNIESGQIEQILGMSNQHMLGSFFINDGKIYFSEVADYTISCYDIATGKKETFLPKGEEKKNTLFNIVSVDFDYMYTYERTYVIKDMSQEREEKICAYTWDGEFVGELPSEERCSYAGEIEPFQVFQHQYFSWIGSDDDRFYYMGESYDTQADEYGSNSDTLVEESGKTIILYVNKSEWLSEGGNSQIYTAGEIAYCP